MMSMAPALLPAISEAMGAGLVTAAERTFAFGHPLLRRAIGEMIPPLARHLQPSGETVKLTGLS
jgi:hypothetical protein